MRIWLALFIVAAFPVLTLAQASPLPWPEITMTTCPKIVATNDIAQRKWKYGQPEQDQFDAIRKMLGAKNYAVPAEDAATFSREYPDSDYMESVLMQEGTAQDYLKNVSGQIKAAAELVRLPVGVPIGRMVGFADLAGLSTIVLPNDPKKEQKLTDLEKWTQCGREAFAQVTWGSSEALDEARKETECIFERTTGFVALMRQDYAVADSTLESARLLNPQDAPTYMMLFRTKIASSPPDWASGTFYLARWAELEPDMPTAHDFLKRIYVLVHGSDKGLSDLTAMAKGNAAPPSGFTIQPPPTKKEHHYAIAAAATAILGLLVYEAVKCPQCFTNASGGSVPANAAGQKIMIFGGLDHRTYLGCLNCSEIASDSVFNTIGNNGSFVSPESIWNRIGQYGSYTAPNSACNPLATDPPAIVDEAGNAYGRLTVNTYNPYLGAGRQFYGWLASEVCHQ